MGAWSRWQARRRWQHHLRYHCPAPRRSWPRPKRTPRWVVLLVAAVLFLIILPFL